ncbi:MAG TPA: cytochrome c3 family protein [Myxococcota bacterium]|jgi:hypothetical protein|nr:cytochrome c3 family protein [Myxococcota bacterium]
MWCASRRRRTLAWLATGAVLSAASGSAGGCDRLGLAPRFDHRDTLLGGTGCERCHDAARVAVPGALRASPAPLRFDHAAHAARFAGDCMRCHSAVARSATHADHAASMVKGCMDCHGGATEALACLSCHRTVGPGATVPASHDAHGAGFRRSHGAAARSADTGETCASCHARPFCGSCHDTSAPLAEARLWPAETLRAVAHGAEYVSIHDADARRAPERCLGCHVQSECVSCHTAAGVAALGPTSASGPRGLSPHPPGWVTVPAGLGGNLHGEAARRDVVACAACHGDGTSCVGCHSPGGPGGSPHASAPPCGALTDAACAPCHAR